MYFLHTPEIYGEDHPQVAIRRNNLGGAWKALGKYRKAIGYFEQAYSSFYRSLGPDHPHTRTAAENLKLVKPYVSE